MAVTYSQLTYPLVATGVSANTGLTGCYDWAHDNGASGNGLGTNWTVSVNGTPPIVTLGSGEQGRDTSNGNTVHNLVYTTTSLSNIGMAVGTGDFSFSLRVRTPTLTGSVTQLHELYRFADGGGNKLQVMAYELAPGTGDGLYHFQIVMAGTSYLVWNDTNNTGMQPNTVHTIGFTRTGTTVKFYLDGTLIKTATVPSFSLLSTTANSYAGVTTYNYNWILIHSRHSNVVLSDADMQTVGQNPYSLYTNTAPADSITVTSPLANGTTGVNIPITGTVAGGDTPTSVEASFNGGAYQTIATNVSGSFSGVLSSQTAGTGTLTVRWVTPFTSVYTTVTNLTVTNQNISFSTPDATTCVVAYRGFQRNLSTNTASVRVAGTYTGSIGSLMYTYAGGAAQTLVASPSGGTFDVTINLPLGSGEFRVYSSANTAIYAALPGVSVGDVAVLFGQSNMVGKASTFIPEVPPSYHSGWITSELDKSNTWRQNVETAAVPLGQEFSSPYSIYAVNGGPAGSAMGELARMMAQTNVPLIVVPCAVGSTNIAAWSQTLTTTSNLYGCMIDRANKLGPTGHRFVFAWLGENDAQSGGYTAAQYTAAYNAIINDWTTRYPGVKWMVCNINNIKDGDSGVGNTGWPYYTQISQGIAGTASNPNVLGIADMLGAWTTNNTHFGQGGGVEVTTVATRMFNVLNISTYASVGSNASTEALNSSSIIGTPINSGTVQSSQAASSDSFIGSLLASGYNTTLQAAASDSFLGSVLVSGSSAGLNSNSDLLTGSPVSSGMIAALQSQGSDTITGSLLIGGTGSSIQTLSSDSLTGFVISVTVGNSVGNAIVSGVGLAQLLPTYAQGNSVGNATVAGITATVVNTVASASGNSIVRGVSNGTVAIKPSDRLIITLN